MSEIIVPTASRASKQGTIVWDAILKRIRPDYYRMNHAGPVQDTVSNYRKNYTQKAE